MKAWIVSSACACIIVIFQILPSNILSGTETVKILPLETVTVETKMEPSGLTAYQDKILCVSDNQYESKIYELIPKNKFCSVKTYLTFRHQDLLKLEKHHPLDMEGICYWNGYFYIVDERDRLIFRVSTFGRVWVVQHDIPDYNSTHGITFSSRENAAFEGIAVDPVKNIFYVANERSDPIIYVLRTTPNDLSLVTTSHIPIKTLLKDDMADVSDLFFEKGYLYVLCRGANTIIKIIPTTGTVVQKYNFSRAVRGLYNFEKRYGFAEGLFLTTSHMYLVLDSNGRNISGKNTGANGTMVIISRPDGF